MAGARKALVTMVIGVDYRAMWEGHYKASLVRYAERHGYDLLLIEDHIDTTPRGKERSPHWQKLLILEHPDIKTYDHVVWIDADIHVNYHHAPCIVTAAGEAGAGESGGIGLVSHNQQYLTPELWQNRWHRAYRLGSGLFERAIGPTPQERYAEAGLPDDMDDMVNTGVMVLRPAAHAGFLRHVYDTHTENAKSANEQMALSYEIFNNRLFQPIDPRFNRTWSEEMVHCYPFLMNDANRSNQPLIAFCVTTAWLNVYFLHFLADGVSRGDVALILERFDDPSRINFQEMLEEAGAGGAATPDEPAG